MATFQPSTASSGPTIDPDQVDELETFLDEWFLGVGNFDGITASVQIPDHGSGDHDGCQPYLTLHGYASFGPVYRPTVREDVREELGDELDELDSNEREDALNDVIKERCLELSGVDTEDFLRELSLFLTEPFVVQTVGFEKCRFPLVGYQYSVDPGGEINHVRLE